MLMGSVHSFLYESRHDWNIVDWYFKETKSATMNIFRNFLFCF